MGGMKDLANLVGELREELEVCMRCGMCRAVCPVFGETGRESDVARGKLALLDGIIEGMFKNPMGVHDRLMRCLLCGSCEAHCPSGVKTFDVFLKARAILTGVMGYSPLKRALFRGLLAYPGLFHRVFEWAASLQDFFLKPADDLLETFQGRALSPLVGERHVRKLASPPFYRTRKALRKPAGKSNLRVAFFVGCVIDKVFPQVADAILHALDRHGVEVHLPRDLGCCGIPALCAGDTVTFAKLVRHNLRSLTSEPFDYLVTGCATCTSTIKKLWPTLVRDFNDQEALQVRVLAERTMDISQFLVEKSVPPYVPNHAAIPAVPIAYHDPCHLKKLLGVGAQPRSLIQAGGLYRLVEMEDPDGCCGCGGSFSWEHHDISVSIGRRKRENIVRSGCRVVATGCPACMLHISDMLSRAGDRIPVRHTLEIYAEALGWKRV